MIMSIFQARVAEWRLRRKADDRIIPTGVGNTSILARPEGRALLCGCNLPLRKAYFWVGREPWRAASPRLGLVKTRERIIHKLQYVVMSAKLLGLRHS